MVAALILSLTLTLISIISFRMQFRNLRRLKEQSFASDEKAYLKGQARRRCFIAGLLLLLAVLLGGAYISGFQQHFEAISELSDQVPPQEPTAEDRQFVKYWTIYWMVVLGLMFLMVVAAIVDYAAVAMYGRTQLRRIANEQRELLDRDLALIRQAKLNDRINRNKRE